MGHTFRRHTAEEKAKAVELYRSNTRLPDIAAQCGVSTTAVRHWLTKAGVEFKKYRSKRDLSKIATEFRETLKMAVATTPSDAGISGNTVWTLDDIVSYVSSKNPTPLDKRDVRRYLTDAGVLHRIPRKAMDAGLFLKHTAEVDGTKVVCLRNYRNLLVFRADTAPEMLPTIVKKVQEVN